MKPMARSIVAATAFILTTSAFAGPQEDRQANMKSIGMAMGTVAKMAKGETEFDAETALKAFVDMKAAAEGFGDLFPEGTETGAETEASPKIFSDRAGFDAKVAEFGAALQTASAEAPPDLNALRATLGAVGANCGGCHKAYRIKK